MYEVHNKLSTSILPCALELAGQNGNSSLCTPPPRTTSIRVSVAWNPDRYHKNLVARGFGITTYMTTTCCTNHIGNARTTLALPTRERRFG